MTYAQWRRFELQRLAVFLFVALAICFVAGCAPHPASTPTPTQGASLDSRGALAAEVTYRAAGVALETSIDIGEFDGPAAHGATAAETKAFAVVTVARAGYDLYQLLVAAGAIPGSPASPEVTAQLSELRQANDAAHLRLQAKLAEAAQR